MSLWEAGDERAAPGTSHPLGCSSVVSDPPDLAASCLMPLLHTSSPHLLALHLPADARAWDAPGAMLTQPGSMCVRVVSLVLWDITLTHD